MNWPARTRAFALAAALALLAFGAAATPADPIETWDAWAADGSERPTQALQRLRAELALEPPRQAHALHPQALQWFIGMVAIDANQVDVLHTAANVLPPAAAQVLWAAWTYKQGFPTTALALLDQANQAWPTDCEAAADKVWTCDYRVRWQLEMTRANVHKAMAVWPAQAQAAQAAVASAARGGDVARQVIALANVAIAELARGDRNAAERAFNQLHRLAQASGSAALAARVALIDSYWYTQLGQEARAQATLNEGIAAAGRADLPHMRAKLQTNLSDTLIRANRYAEALSTAEAAIPVLRAHADKISLLTALTNAGIARIGLRQFVPAGKALDEINDMLQRAGALSDQAATLQEFAAAYADAGDHATALKWLHEQRRINETIDKQNLEAALDEVKGRYASSAEQQKLAQMNRDNDLLAAQMRNESIMRRVWAALAALVLLGMGAAVWIYRRVRQTHDQLQRNQAFLRARTERDSLTGLANRRALASLTLADGVQQAFRGGLMLVDIDHFKRVNDGVGHAAGDAVLQEVARRLVDAVGERGHVVRWGGEEFLIYLPGASARSAHELAGVLLHTIGSQPIALPSGALSITTSVGYGAFPLPPGALPLSMEQAINWVDMALYTAKNQGRNRAVGVTQVNATDAAMLAEAEADFERACAQGRIALNRTLGPQMESTFGTLTLPPGALKDAAH